MCPTLLLRTGVYFSKKSCRTPCGRHGRARPSMTATSASDDSEAVLAVVLAAVAAQQRSRKRKRALLLLTLNDDDERTRYTHHTRLVRVPMQWEERLACLSDRQFMRRYRMPKHAFAQLFVKI